MSKGIDDDKTLSSDLRQANALFQNLKQQLDNTSTNNAQHDLGLCRHIAAIKTNERVWFDMGNTNSNQQSMLPTTAIVVLR